MNDTSILEFLEKHKDILIRVIKKELLAISKGLDRPRMADCDIEESVKTVLMRYPQGATMRELEHGNRPIRRLNKEEKENLINQMIDKGLIKSIPSKKTTRYGLT